MADLNEVIGDLDLVGILEGLSSDILSGDSKVIPISCHQVVGSWHNTSV